MAVSHSLMAVCVGHTHSLTVQLCLVLFRKCWIVKCSHRCSWTAHTVKVHTHTHTTHMTAARLLTDSYQYTNDSLSIILNSYWSKTADIIKRLYYPPSRHLNVNTMLSYITCCFFILIFSVLLTISQHFTAVIDWEVIMHQLIKFCWSWSQLFLRYCDFSVFNMVSGGLKCITMLNFVEFSQSFVDIIHFFDFSRWWQSTIFDLFGAYLVVFITVYHGIEKVANGPVLRFSGESVGEGRGCRPKNQFLSPSVTIGRN